ncbi:MULTISPECIES: phosphoribosylaminoimidazolesuccinocarboxamide synthase [unclassified Rothia (in: high G+C Gram-positive bacteria)]|uniref:phosphoribosylaminoimidazolesuccinocarboxamide synthase n=1 Tax=unclassified Rothia (in: high G+C Gram-positive bacteria) TaxID=2689056 RepID=UPI00195C4D70|nr:MULTISPECIES: phosphoribosylaminoimidazolesuccinocarboxamide synthase [unclassified Rothia (in: high G+C Gram-positive bacteria)]MBM7051998.1 phosphoribosylaminoimidazolesuccinocarboxamide synthase [Rothia sp. ZJ1223]QRZ61941.1 phosphoribosylaminoimidazolesuccinocarboxamide synthase [Rothia sp. ZJ932]
MVSSTTPLSIPGWKHNYSGKVRDLYVPNDERFEATGTVVNDDAELRAGSVMVVASDRISAFDKVLPTVIPDKGKILTQMSLWWFDQLDGVPNHVLSTDVPEEVAGRAMICRSLNMFPIECIVRGYLTGAGLAEYKKTGELYGHQLPEGLLDGSRLETPFFTPTGKAEVGEHDEPISYEEMYQQVGESMGDRLTELSIYVYSTAEKIAREQGIILADTKVEFGLDSYRGEITLGDEVLTPDSSRFWDASTWEPGKPQASFDKQFIRDWLKSDASGWDGVSELPEAPTEIIEKTRARYIEAFERLTGSEFKG